MKAITKQGIAQSLRESLTAYLNEGFVTDDGDWFVQEGDNGRYPTDNAISYLSNWIESSYDNDEDEDKGNIEDWKEISIVEFIDFLELQIGNSDDKTMYEMIEEKINE